jgi:hypothetical protein
MLLPALLLLQLAPTQDARIVDGRSARLDVMARRIDTSIVVDGVLSEPYGTTPRC